MLQGLAHQTALFFQKEQLSDRALWAKFVDVFRSQPDGENCGWRGEYWGKMMRGGALIYAYTRDEGLYDVLTASIRDMMTVAEADGRVSTYTRDTEFDAWDIWCRKYVILASEYYLEICKDEALCGELTDFICRCADYILAHIGKEKKSITSASRSWYGVNSSSLLEPIVRLYHLTGAQKYLDFATYIVNCGGAEGINIFELAYENRLCPYQYGVSKAYEMMSCFEGLLEYYKATGIEKYKIAVIHFAEAVLRSEISIIGCCGVTHELFDHTAARQTVRYDGVSQETCVSVTWMKFCARLLELTGDSKYADAMEQTFYNAYLGTLNVHHKESPYIFQKFADMGGVESTFLPVDSYSPLIPGKRGQKVGGNQRMPDRTYYGCCACIAAAGVGVYLQKLVTVEEDGITVNFYEAGTVQLQYKGVGVTLEMQTAYPVEGNVRVYVRAERPVHFTLRLRNPGWTEALCGYTHYTREWHEDAVELGFAMSIRLHTPMRWEQETIYADTSKNTAMWHAAAAMQVEHRDEDDHYVAVTLGPMTLAADSRTGKPADSIFTPTYEATPCEARITEDEPCLLRLHFAPACGEAYDLVDYASAGRDWESVIAAWLPTQ